MVEAWVAHADLAGQALFRKQIPVGTVVVAVDVTAADVADVAAIAGTDMANYEVAESATVTATAAGHPSYVALAQPHFHFRTR